MRRGEIRWASRFADGASRPVLVVQDNEFNDSRLPTVVCSVISADPHLAHAPGNVFLPARASGLGKDAVANVAQLLTLDRNLLSKPLATLGGRLLREIDDGLRLVLSL